MTLSFKSLAVVAAGLLPVSAGAATMISADGLFIDQGILESGGSISFDFQATEDLRVTELALSGLGQDRDVDNVEWSVSNGGMLLASGIFETFTPETGNLTSGSAGITNIVLSMDDVLTVLFEDGENDRDVSVDATLLTAQVPLPAASLMLLAGLGAFGAVRRRQSRRAAA